MDIFSVDFTHNELTFIRQSLDFPTIKGTDAKFLANLQTKLENELIQIQQMIQIEEQKKIEGLQQIITQEEQSKGKKPS